MSVSIQRSVVEQFSFNGENVRSVYVKGEGECLVARDVCRAVGYNDNGNGKRAIRLHVPEEYKVRLSDAISNLEKGVKIDPLHQDTILLKEPGLYCFLLRCGKDEAKPFMEWVCEEVLPREVRKRELDAERHKVQEKDTQLALINDDLTESQELVRHLEFNNTGFQGELRAKDQEIARLHERVVPHAMNFGKNNVVMIVRKHTRKNDDCHFEFPCTRV